MKKLFALILCAVLALSACAFAEAPAGGYSYTLSGLTVSAAGQNLDLSGITVCADVFDGDPGALLLHLDKDGETVAAIGFTQLDNLYVMHLESPTLGHKDYAIDPVKELAKSLDDLRDQLIAALQSADTTAIAEGIMDFFTRVSEAVEAPAEEPAPTEEPVAEEPAEDAEVVELTIDDDALNNVLDVLKDCDYAHETVSLEGVTIDFNGAETPVPDGDYSHSSFTVDTEHFLQAMEAMSAGDAAAQMREAGVSVELSGDFHIGKTVDAGFGSITLAATDGEMNATSGFGVLQVPTDTGSAVTIVAGQSQNDAVTSVAITAAKSEGTDVTFGPDEVDVDNLINLSDMDDAEMSETMLQDLGLVAGEALSALLAPALESMAAELPAAE